jgi:molybdenum cofactor cytidylyltransferase
MRVAAVVLAAGASTRLGSPKQLVMLGGEMLLERAVRVAREAGCVPVVVVLGASAEAIQSECELGDAIVVTNQDWTEGMGASVRLGVRVLRDVDGCVVMTCDMPAVTASHLRLLISSGELTASGYAGRRGVPAYFPVAMFPELMKLRGDTGAKELLRSAHCEELMGGEFDVDAAEDLKRVMELFG